MDWRNHEYGEETEKKTRETIGEKKELEMKVLALENELARTRMRRPGFGWRRQRETRYYECGKGGHIARYCNERRNKDLLIILFVLFLSRRDKKILVDLERTNSVIWNTNTQKHLIPQMIKYNSQESRNAE